MMIRMTHQDLMNAYAACKKHFDLKAAQRNVLDGSVQYLDIMIAVHQDRYQDAENLLWDAGVLTGPVVKDQSRAAFYADDKVWQHENCGTECDGSDHA